VKDKAAIEVELGRLLIERERPIKIVKRLGESILLVPEGPKIKQRMPMVRVSLQNGGVPTFRPARAPLFIERPRLAYFVGEFNIGCA
jgi:hypothetical protein